MLISQKPGKETAPYEYILLFKEDSMTLAVSNLNGWVKSLEKDYNYFNLLYTTLDTWTCTRERKFGIHGMRIRQITLALSHVMLTIKVIMAQSYS